MGTAIFPNRLPAVKEKPLLNLPGCCHPRFLSGLLLAAFAL